MAFRKPRFFLLFLIAALCPVYLQAKPTRMQQVQTLYQQMTAENTQQRRQVPNNHANKTTLRMLTINLGLLNHFPASPEYAKRSQALLQELERVANSKNYPHIIFIQELWYQNDFNTILRFARGRHQYTAGVVSYQNESVNRRGLQVLVKKNAFQQHRGWMDNNRVHTRFLEFKRPNNRPIRAAWEFNLRAGVAYQRGLLVANLRLTNGRTLLVGTTHLTPTLGSTNLRREQITAMKSLLDQNDNNIDYVALGWDSNASPDLANVPAKNSPSWEANRQPYIDFHQKPAQATQFPFLDALIVAPNFQNRRRFTWDRQRNTMTYWGPSASEPEQRVDFISVGARGQGRKLYVQSAGLSFTSRLRSAQNGNVILAQARGIKQPATTKNGLYDLNRRNALNNAAELYLSDHFGVRATLVLF